MCAWATPTDKSTGDLITTAIWNADVVANTKYLKGQAGVVAIENQQTFGQSGAARATRATNQSLNDVTWTSIALNEADVFDYDTLHDPASNNTRITIERSGIYLITGDVSFAADATGTRQARLLVNNSLVAGINSAPSSAVLAPTVGVATIYYIAADSYVELQAWQNSGGALNVSSGNLAVAYLGNLPA